MEPVTARARAGTSPREYLALAIATLVLLVVLISSFMAIQLFRLRSPDLRCEAPAARVSEPFLGAFQYSPGRGGHGVTTGAMPSIETGQCGGLCCGLLGVPP